ncbi:MAG: hypothetical protein EOO06_03305 [Chitinophagaceae bacterium]|nr:MAG: hypothetical protein EOO06_03305 [Chitinophagaceae bacterium]
MDEIITLQLSNQSKIAYELKLWDAFNQLWPKNLSNEAWFSDGASISSTSTAVNYLELLFISTTSPFTVRCVRLHRVHINGPLTILKLTLIQKDANGSVTSRVLTPEPGSKQNDDVMFTSDPFVIDGNTLITIEMPPQSSFLIDFLKKNHFR